MSDQYVTRADFAQVTDAMSAIQETTTRVDERVRTLLERQTKSDANIYEIRDTINSLVNRVTILESRDATEIKTIVERSREKIVEMEKQIAVIALKESNHDAKWKVILDFIGKVAWVSVAAYLLYKLGFNPPPLS